ncbi:MAG: hypothetical protein U0836_07820 [Pirellulales bacterium]
MKIRLLSLATLSTWLTAVPAWAEPADSATGFLGSLVDRLDGGQLIGALAVTLIFGTGLMAVLTNGLASIVRAFNGAPEDDALAERLEGLEQRLGRIEQQLAVRQATPLDATQAR